MAISHTSTNPPLAIQRLHDLVQQAEAQAKARRMRLDKACLKHMEGMTMREMAEVMQCERAHAHRIANHIHHVTKAGIRWCIDNPQHQKKN